MQRSAVKSTSTIVLIAILVAIAAAAIGISVSATPAHAALYMPGTSVGDAKTIAPAKTKLVGTWKLVKSTKSSDNAAIKHNKKIDPRAKCTMTLKKNGKLVLKDYNGSTKSYKWVATAKQQGFLTYSGMLVSPIKVKGKTLKITFPETSATQGFTWTLKKI